MAIPPKVPKVKAVGPAVLRPIAGPVATPGERDWCAGRRRFGRRIYLACSAAIFLAVVIGMAMVAPENRLLILTAGLVAWFPFAVLRAGDVGMSAFSVLFALVPVANLYLAYRLAFAPRGYAITGKPDLGLKIGHSVIGGFIVLLLLWFFLMGSLVALIHR